MVIQATDEQVLEMAKLAILASTPVGMGFLQHDPTLTSERIDDLEPERGGLYIDYYRGRMVKFTARKREGGYEFSENVRPDYQSWCVRYPSYQALFDAVATQPVAAPVGE